MPSRTVTPDGATCTRTHTEQLSVDQSRAATYAARLGDDGGTPDRRDDEGSRKVSNKQSGAGDS